LTDTGKKWEYNETVHQLFIDFKKAYESVRREVLHNILIEFGDEVMGGWRKLHEEELHDLYSLRSIIRIIKWTRMRGGTCSTNGGKRKMCIGYW
jgi:hypothetical protein